MKKACIVVLIMVCLLVMPAAAKAELIYNSATGHWYGLVNAGVYNPGTMTERKWETAEANAAATGGHLVTINDAAENAWLVNTFSSAVYTAAFMGLYKNTSDQWVWSSGENAAYRQWNTGEPSGDGGYTAIYLNFTGDLNHSWNGNWNDLGAKMKDDAMYRYGIAEYTQVPIPSAAWLLATGLIGLVGVRRRFSK